MLYKGGWSDSTVDQLVRIHVGVLERVVIGRACLMDENGDFISNLENMNAECNFCNKSFLLGIGYLIHFKVEFKGL
jgi:hypothetical protein